MPKNKTIQSVINDELREAMERYCRRKRVTRADVIREGICHVIGRPDLNGGVKMGPPTLEERAKKGAK